MITVKQLLFICRIGRIRNARRPGAGSSTPCIFWLQTPTTVILRGQDEQNYRWQKCCTNWYLGTLPHRYEHYGSVHLSP